MLAAPLLLALTLAPADASTPPDGPPRQDAVRVEDAGELQGEWEIVSFIQNGDDRTTNFKGDRWVIAGTSLRLANSAGRVYHTTDVRRDNYSSPTEVGYRAVYRRAGDYLLWELEPGVALWTLRRVKK
jgi:hypothetical protein